MTTRYLVAWAGDRHCGDALRLGAVLAKTFDATLDVIYVARTGGGLAAAQAGERAFEQALMAEAKAKMRRAAAELPEGLDVQLHVLRSPSVAAGILQAVKELDSDLLVIGTGHGGGMPVMSQVASTILHASPVPVALAPRGYANTSHDRLDEIACAVGTRAGAQVVVDDTLSAVLRTGVKLKLISLVELGTDAKASAEARAAATAAIEAARDTVAGRAPVELVVAEGRNATAAIHSVDWNPNSVVMVGSSRLAAGRQTFLGSMAARMLAALPVPMIVVPAPGQHR
ncbi:MULTISPECIES: universal stress protein [unclassified Luteococcus]|uniref:universal stress protein n=1 Tax=unclassified Luteococcus TaxID=2639923 RepID=UPI00313B7669